MKSKLSKYINEIKVNKPNSISSSTGDAIIKNLNLFIDEAYNDEILEFDKYFKENTLKTLIDSDDFEINDLIANFVKDQMVFNNHHIIRGNKEILLNFSNLNLVAKQDILDYAKEHPKLNEFLYSLIKEMYIENELNPYLNKSKSELRTALIKLSHNGDLDDWSKRDFRHYLEAEFDYYVLDPSYLDSYLDADELRHKLLRADLIKEIKMNRYQIKTNKTFTEEFLESFNKKVKNSLKQINENETAFHGSSNYFTKFNQAGIGGGQGSQSYGWGFYFGKKPDIAKNYAQTAGPNTRKTKTLFQGQTAEELGLKYENEVFFGLPTGLKTAKEYIDYAQEMISILEEEPEFEGKEDTLKSYRQFIEIIKDLEVENEPMHYLYKVTLFPNKTPDYLNWDVGLPQYQVDKINNQAQKENLDFQIKAGSEVPPIMGALTKHLGSPKNVSLFLLRAGIDGYTHSDNGVRIVIDPNEIHIDKIYKSKEFDSVKESKKTQLNEYSEKIVNQMIAKFQKEMKNTLSNDDIKLKLNRFDQIKSNLPKKIAAGLKGEAGGISVAKKFTEPDPKTNKILNPQDILNYTWKDLETVLDAYGEKAEKTSNDFKTVQDAELMDIKGVPVIYSGNGLKIYEGSDYGSCIKLNYAFKYKGEDNKIYSYGFCIGRKEEASNQYYTYRFGRGGAFRSFYFVADTTQNADIEGNPNDRNNFLNWYHFFVIHAFDDGKFGVTDAVNQWGTNHELTNSDKGVSWEEVGAFMVKNGGESGKKAWDKIKGLKNVFKYVEPSSEETDQALVRDKILNFEQFKNLNRNQKRIYISRRADQPNAFNSEMFRIIDTELKNLALRTGSGFKPTYTDLKDSQALLRSYTKFKFTRAMDDYKSNKIPTVVPLPFVKYLTDDEKQQYLDTFDDNLTFEYIEKYFGKEATEQYVEKQSKKLDFLPQAAIKYIKNERLRNLYEVYSKLFEPWQYSNNTNITDEQLENISKMPEQNINPVPISEKQWKALSNKEREIIIKLAERFNNNSEYLTLLYALPIVIKNQDQTYVLVPKSNSNTFEYNSWVLADKQGRVVKDNISGQSQLGDNTYLEYGPNGENVLTKIYNIKDLHIEQ